MKLGIIIIITCPASSLSRHWRGVSPAALHTKCREGWQPCGVAPGQAGAHGWDIFPGNNTGIVSDVATPRHRDNPKLPGRAESLQPAQPASAKPILGIVGAAPQPHGALALLS